MIQIPTGSNNCRALGIDGTWFESANERHFDPLGPGGRHETILILKPEVWRSHGEPLYLKPGTHVVRVIYDFFSSSPNMHLRLLSNPVEIDILPADGKE